MNAISTALGVGFQLISVPVCLTFWGQGRYGTWLSLFSAFMLLRGLDGGFTTFVGNKLNYLYHKDRNALRRHLASAVFGIVIIGSMQLMLAAATLLFEPLSHLLGMPGDPHDGLAAKLGLLVLMLSWVLTGSYLGIVHKLLIPAGLMFQSAWWAMAFQVGQFAAIMCAAILEMNPLQTSLCFAVLQVAICVASAIYVRRMMPEFSPWLHDATVRVGLRDLGHSLFLTAGNVVQQGTLNGSVLLVAALSGPIGVPIFTTTRTLTNLWNSVTTILSTPLLPDVVRIHAHGETHKLVAINQAYWALVGSAVNVGALLTYPLIPYVYARWTSHAIDLDQPLLCFLLGSVVMANVGALMALHLNGINSLRIGLVATLCRAIFGIGGGAAGFSRYGLAGFGLGILAGEIVATSLVTFHFMKYEVADKGLRIAPAELGPVSLGAGATVLYFTGAGFGLWAVGWVWLGALVCAVAAALWGWNALEPELHGRLKNIPGRLLRS